MERIALLPVACNASYPPRFFEPADQDSVMGLLKNDLLGPAGLILLGVFISAVGGFWAARQQAASDRRIAELSQGALHSVTGGDSFCYIHFQDMVPGTGQIITIHHGSYPIYDVEAKIVDLDRSVTAKNPEEEVQALSGKTVHVGNLTKGFSRAITTWNETIQGQQRLNVFLLHVMAVTYNSTGVCV